MNWQREEGKEKEAEGERGERGKKQDDDKERINKRNKKRNDVETKAKRKPTLQIDKRKTRHTWKELQ